MQAKYTKETMSVRDQCSPALADPVSKARPVLQDKSQTVHQERGRIFGAPHNNWSKLQESKIFNCDGYDHYDDVPETLW